MLCVTLGSLSSAEASHSRALGKKHTREARRLGRGKIKARGERAPVFSLQRSRSRFFLWCLLTGASAEERALGWSHIHVSIER